MKSHRLELARRRAVASGVITLLLAAQLIAAASSLSAQETAPGQNKIFLEGLGSGLIWSLNYERSLEQRLGLRVGLGGLPLQGAEFAIGFAMISLRFGSWKHSVHFGGGPGVLYIKEVWVAETENETVAYGTLAAAYEFRPWPRGIVLRAAFTPFFTTDEFGPWFGVGVGYAF